MTENTQVLEQISAPSPGRRHKPGQGTVPREEPRITHVHPPSREGPRTSLQLRQAAGPT